MHPLLFEIPLPHWQLPIRYLMFCGSALGVLVALLGWRARAKDVSLLGAVGALLGALFGIRTSNESVGVSDLPIYGYGAQLALAFVLGWIVSMRLATRSGISRASAANAYFASALSALVGARVLYVLTNLRSFNSIWMALDVQSGGLVAYGGFLGGLLGAWLYGRVSGNGFLAWADSAAPAVALGLFVTRIGCYLYGCDFGRPLSNDAPRWLRATGTFPRWDSPALPLGTGAPAWQWHVERGLVDFDATASLPVHPTQLYEACVGLVLFLGLLWLWHRKRFTGQVFLTLGATYGTARFLLELWRDDPERGAFGPVWNVQIGVAVALVAVGVAVALGPAATLPRPRLRRILQGMALLPSPIGYWLARPGPAASVLNVQLLNAQLPSTQLPSTQWLTTQWSTSQWLGLASAIGSCLTWVWLSRTSPAAVAGEPTAGDTRGHAKEALHSGAAATQPASSGTDLAEAGDADADDEPQATAER